MSRPYRELTSAILGACFAVACGSDSTPSTPPAPTFTEITQNVITGVSCGGPFCHGSTVGGFMLGSTLYSELVDQPASGSQCGTSGLKRVVAGQPEQSLLYLKLSQYSSPPCGVGMPSGSAPLSADKVEMVKQWIAAGAKNN